MTDGLNRYKTLNPESHPDTFKRGIVENFSALFEAVLDLKIQLEKIQMEKEGVSPKNFLAHPSRDQLPAKWDYKVGGRK